MPADADLVIGVPESSTPAAIGYAQGSGIPYGQGLVKNSYVGRTFIQPSETIRQRGVRLKYNPLREAIAGKRLVVVDDSIVRGTTQRAIVGMLREAGAAEVHVRISSPPVAWPCYFGIDFPSRAELLAGNLTVEEIRKSIGADSLGFVSLAGLIEATTRPVRAAVPRLLRRQLSDPGSGQREGQAPAGARRRPRAGERPVSGGQRRPGQPEEPAHASYARAGVDIAAGERAVDLIRASVARTAGPEVSAGSAGSPGCSTRPG